MWHSTILLECQPCTSLEIRAHLRVVRIPRPLSNVAGKPSRLNPTLVSCIETLTQLVPYGILDIELELATCTLLAILFL